ncbi:hypothetical protein GQR58_029645 [Nymphon striatum]|nr:hypothetical protein GQR58_029645 [Nymphon striatum]
MHLRPARTAPSGSATSSLAWGFLRRVPAPATRLLGPWPMPQPCSGLQAPTLVRHRILTPPLTTPAAKPRTGAACEQTHHVAGDLVQPAAASRRNDPRQKFGQDFLGVLIIHADATFHRDIHIHNGTHFGDTFRHQRGLFHQHRTKAPRLHTVRRTTDIEVDLVIPRIGPDLGGLCQLARIRTRQVAAPQDVQPDDDPANAAPHLAPKQAK